MAADDRAATEAQYRRCVPHAQEAVEPVSMVEQLTQIGDEAEAPGLMGRTAGGPRHSVPGRVGK